MNSDHQHSAQRGFTLLEVLVVLVITSLISVVLIQGFSLILGVRGSVQNRIVGLEQALLKQNLYQLPLRGILPDYPDRPHIFHGEPKSLRGLTISPLQSQLGSPVGFSMVLEYDSRRGKTELIYQEDGLEPQVLGNFDSNDVAFQYSDRDGIWQDAWPPTDEAPQTPWLIQLDMDSGFPSTLVTAVNGPHQRTLRFQDLPFSSN
jgi:general secretion pathway protein J